MPSRDQIQSVLAQIEQLEADQSLRPAWSDMTFSERFAALQEIEWAGFSRRQEMRVTGRILASEPPEMWMLGIPDKEPRGAMSEIKSGQNGGDRETLLAETHRLTREIGFVGFRREFMNEPEAIKEYPDAAEREKELREFWDDKADYATFRETHATADIGVIERYRDALVALQGEPESVQAEFYHRISALGRSEREGGAPDIEFVSVANDNSAPPRYLEEGYNPRPSRPAPDKDRGHTR
jgi:hypothetical protein